MADDEKIEAPQTDAKPLPYPGGTPAKAGRATAVAEIIICSGFPTQFALAATLAAFGYSTLNLTYLVVLSLADTVLVLALILLFLQSHGEPPGELFLGGRPIGREILAGLPLIFGALGLALVAILTIRWMAPWLEPTEANPLQTLIDTRQTALIFALVVVVAGGVREELQRAFVLRRFDYGLGGPKVGVVVGSLAFGAGHLLQGADAALTTVLLGAFWAITYLRRGSVVAPIVSHSGFNLLQLAQFVLGLGQTAG